jgi:hypothetical protein
LPGERDVMIRRHGKVVVMGPSMDSLLNPADVSMIPILTLARPSRQPPCLCFIPPLGFEAKWDEAM